MAIMLHPPERGRFPLCTGIIEMSGVCESAGPFFLARPAGGAKSDASRVANSEGCLMTSQRNDDSPAGNATEDRKTRKGTFSRKRVVTRLWHTAERQVAEIETRMAAVSGDPLALERDAKTLAVIAKTVRDLVALDGEALSLSGRTKTKEQAPAHGSKSAHTDPLLAIEAGASEFGPRDIEGFRAELARRLDELRRERTGGEAP